jgi:hypothetical protein
MFIMSIIFVNNKEVYNRQGKKIKFTKLISKRLSTLKSKANNSFSNTSIFLI